MRKKTYKGLNPLRSDRESILAHNDRAGNYESLVTSLLGYRQSAGIEAPNIPLLQYLLKEYKKRELCLEQGCKKGFVYVGMNYGEIDKFGKTHGRHALTLKDIELNKNGEPTGIFLTNPWSTRKKPEYFSLEDLTKRKIQLITFIPPEEKIPKDNVVKSTQTSSQPPKDSPTTYQIFDQFA